MYKSHYLTEGKNMGSERLMLTFISTNIPMSMVPTDWLQFSRITVAGVRVGGWGAWWVLSMGICSAQHCQGQKMRAVHISGSCCSRHSCCFMGMPSS